MNARETGLAEKYPGATRSCVLVRGTHQKSPRTLNPRRPMDFRFTAASGVLEAQRPAGNQASPSPTKKIATARRHSRPWPREFVCTITTTSPPDTPQGRAGNHISCAACGKRLCPKQGSRRMRFCDAACRQSAFRAKKWASRYEGPGPLRSVRNTLDGSGPYNGNFGDRGSGIHGPMEVISRELFEGLIWRPAVSLDGVRVEIARLGVVPSPAKSVVDKTRTPAAGVR